MNNLKNYLLNDSEFIHVFDTYNLDLEYNYEKSINDLLEYCFDSFFNPYLDKEYLDIAYFKDGDTIYNISDIYDVYITHMEEGARL